MATSFYYAMEAGLSVGFCEPSEIDDWSKLFTTIYVMLGSTLISGIVITWIAELTNVSKHNVFYERLEDHIIEEEEEKESEKNCVLALLSHTWFYIKLYSGWYSIRTELLSLMCLFFWSLLGVLYGVVSAHV